MTSTEVKTDSLSLLSNHAERTLSYRVEKEEDFGRIVCDGENEAQGQAQPCVFVLAQPVR